MLGSSRQGSRAASPEQGEVKAKGGYGVGDGLMSYRNGMYVSHFEGDGEEKEVGRNHCCCCCCTDGIDFSSVYRWQGDELSYGRTCWDKSGGKCFRRQVLFLSF